MSAKPRQKPATKKKAKLSAQQQCFVDAYLGEAKGNASEAARIAGYRDCGKQGYRLTKNAQIKALIAQALRESPLRATRDDVLDYLGKLVLGEGVKDATHRDRLKAAELLAKHYGLLTERVELSGPGSGPIEVRPVLRLPQQDFRAERRQLEQEEREG